MPQLHHLATALLIGTTLAVRQECYAPGERAQGAPGFPAVRWMPCCGGGILVERAGKWGRFCPVDGDYAAVKDGDCYQTGERAKGAPGMPAVEWKRCCRGNDVQSEVEGQWGKFCVGDNEALESKAAARQETLEETTAVTVDTNTPVSVTAATTLPIDTSTTLPIGSGDKCEGLGSSVRKEVKSMTATEWDNYVEAHRRLRENGVYAEFSAAHGSVSRHDEYFLIWHRLMLTEWNKALDAVFPGVVQPFFDWSAMPANIFDDEIFGPGGRFGGDGHVIPDGSFAGLPVARSFRRDRSLTTATRIGEVRELYGFGDFTEQTELIHNTFHTIVGGDMLTLAKAPNDFLFYMHHSFIDKMWKDWQLSGNLLKVSPSIDLDAVMEPWGKTAREVLDASDCANYEGSSGSLAGDSVFAVDDEFIFETRTAKIEAEKEAATKLISSPEAVKMEMEAELQRENDLRQASLEIGEDPARVDRAISGLRDVVLKGDSSLDLNDADNVINSTMEEIVANAEEQLTTLEAGELTSSNSGLAKVRNVNA